MAAQMDSTAPSSILVVDDNAAALYATGRVLRSAGYQVIEATTGTAALALAEQAALVVLDINLPDIDGFEVCRRLRANAATSHLPVLHLSATFIHHADFAVGLAAGADSYLTRPVEPLVLIASVRTLLFARQADQVRRRLDARLREMFDLAPVAMAVLDSALRLESVNPAFCALTGSRPGELIGLPADQLLVFREGEGELFSAAASDGGNLSRWKAHGSLRRKDGSIAQVEWQVAREGSSGARILTLTDITLRLRTETEREALLASERAARAEAERSNRLKEEFLATLSHELRTPLSAILGWSAVIGRTTGLPPTVLQGVQAIERNSRLQAQMIADLLDYAGIAFGKMRLATSVVDPYPIVRAALDVVQTHAQSAGISLHAVLAQEEICIEADPARLEQIVWNLLSNAIKFSAAGGSVELSAGRAGERFRLVVRDHGKGIAAEFLPRIFERFSQQDASSTRSHGGLGLGLAIVKQLAELHGGSIEAMSEGENRGATFTLELPLTDKRPQASLLADSRPQRSHDLGGVVALVVEDDADARQLIQRILTDAGAEVFEAASAEVALQLLDGSGANMLVSDIGMAGQDGYELLRRVRARGYGPDVLPAIALTAFARTQDRDDALAAGFQAHLVKPFGAQALVGRIAALRRTEPTDA
jgi:PAS domain S-box-containing protein